MYLGTVPTTKIQLSVNKLFIALERPRTIDSLLCQHERKVVKYVFTNKIKMNNNVPL